LKKSSETVKVNSFAAMSGSVCFCEDLQIPPPYSFPKVPDAAGGESIFTERAMECNTEIWISSQYKAAILLEGLIGTSWIDWQLILTQGKILRLEKAIAFPLMKPTWRFRQFFSLLKSLLTVSKSALQFQEIAPVRPSTTKFPIHRDSKRK
jgi:hypothetical protein